MEKSELQWGRQEHFQKQNLYVFGISPRWQEDGIILNNKLNNLGDLLSLPLDEVSFFSHSKSTPKLLEGFLGKLFRENVSQHVLGGTEL